MHYSETRDQAGEYLRITLGLLAKYNLPPDPTCYCVWYEYVSGKNPNLKKAIDDTLENSIPIDLAIIKKFYKDHITNPNRKITEKLVNELKTIISGISCYAIATTGDIAGHGQRLELLAKEIDNTHDIKNIIINVENIIQEVKSIVISGKSLQGQMTSSSEELSLLREKLEISRQDAETDPLTGILNRRGFEKIVQAAIEVPNPLFSIIMIDIDHFKEINDTFGHLVGDSILKAFAQLLRQQLKGKDTPARFGGDEFILLLPETSLQQAMAVGESIREKLAAREWKSKKDGRYLGKRSISLGVSMYRPNELPATTINRADTALYCAKKGGRNRVVSENQLP